MHDLTNRQQEILAYLKSATDERGFAPSIREVAAHFGMTAKGAYDHIKALERKGVITRQDRTARSVRIK